MAKALEEAFAPLDAVAKGADERGRSLHARRCHLVVDEEGRKIRCPRKSAIHHEGRDLVEGVIAYELRTLNSIVSR